MDIVNKLSPRRYRTVDDLLAFISIYDDRRRTRAYMGLLRKHRRHIVDAICVEGGCGIGIFSAEMARLGAKKVYAVEHNPMLVELAREQIDDLPKNQRSRIEVVHEDLKSFIPPGKVNTFVHEFYGQLLYDEDLYLLDHLKFKPQHVLPDGGLLLAGVVSFTSYTDEIVTARLAEKLRGVLVSGLFEEKMNELKFPVLKWKYGSGLKQVKRSLQGMKGDLLCFGVEVTHGGIKVCEAARCPNWSYVWTPRAGDKFRFDFVKEGPGMACRFTWID